MGEDELLGLAGITVELGVRRVELGTSVLKRYGCPSITSLRQALPESFIYVDTKTLDQPMLELPPVIDAGADAVTILAGAEDHEIVDSVELCRSRAVELSVSMMGYPPSLVAPRATEIYELGARSFVAHGSGRDLQTAFSRLRPCTQELAGLPPAHILVGGGITEHNLPTILTFDPDVVIVGRFLLESQDFGGAVSRLLERLSRSTAAEG